MKGLARVGIVTGLLVEANCLPAGPGFPPVGPLVFCSGADAARAHDGAAQLVADGAAALVSFGLAAGLAPIIRPGDVVVADAVITPQGEKLTTDDAWRRRLLAYLGGPTNGCRSFRVAGTDEVLGSERQKRRLCRATGAGAADMESHAVAAVARELGVPFLVVRAVVDPVDHALPSAASMAVRPDGATDYFVLAKELVLRPWELRAFVHLAQNGRLALTALRRAAATGSPLLSAP